MPDFHFDIQYNELGNVFDDAISGVTGTFVPQDLSEGAPGNVRAVAAAFLNDLNGGQIRLVFDSIQPEVQIEFSDQHDARVGAFLEAQSGRIEVVPPPPDLAIGNAVVREGGVLDFNVSLRPASDQVVTVDFSVLPDTATTPDDFTHPGGSLTFAIGETDKTISVGTIDDSLVEINEELRVVLSNPVGAPLHRDTGIGVILDNDDPGFPDQDPEFFPQEAPCICTPLAGIYNTNVSEIWHMKMLGGNALLRVAAVSINNMDPSWVEALVYDAAGNLVGSN
jgi:hypothetical protein